MTQEEKDLLLNYLSMALPYGVIFKDEFDESLQEIHYIKNEDVFCKNYPHLPYWIETIKPYLRPMSSMTNEEKEEMHNLLSPEGTAIYENNGIALPINHYGEYVPYEFMNRIIQYLLKKHFDFMGLIPKCLAIEVTEENNPY